jgi:carboxyl-terminal processing protease
MRRKLGILLLVFLSGFVGFLFGQKKLQWQFYNFKPAILLNSEVPKNRYVDFSLFWVIWDKLAKLYVDKAAVDSQKMVYGAISGMVSALGDPYTVFLPPAQNKEANDDLAGEFGGVGIHLGYKNNFLAVIAPLPNTPAEKAGVLSGDLILHIKDDSKKIDLDSEKMSISQAVSNIRGPVGTKVELTLGREGAKELIKVDLTRETIIDKSVTLKIIERNNKKIAHLQLSKFGDKTPQEWQDAISKILDLGSKIGGIVLDLRNNPGGYLDGAVYIAGEFLPAGKLVVSQVAGDGTREELKVNRNGRLLKNKLVILVNEGSASASEIVSGALSDHKRAKLVGTKTFGKGSVQSPENLPDGSGIHITVAKWLRPNGEWIDKIGITPDVEIKSEKIDPDKPRDTELEAKNDVQLNRAMIDLSL